MTTGVDDDKGRERSALASGLSLVEKAWEWHWALRVASIVLFADVALLWREGRGVLGWSHQAGDLMQNLGFLAVAVAVFGLLAAVLIPVGEAAVQRMAAPVMSSVVDLLAPPATARPWTPRGCVRPWKLRDLALQRHDEFLLRLYKEHAQAAQRAEATQQQLGTLVFGVLCLALLNGMANGVLGGQSTVVRAAMQAAGPWGPALAAAAGLACVVILRFAWVPPWAPGWIYYPPLAEEIAAEEHKARRWNNALM